MVTPLANDVFSISSQEEFNVKALEIFRYQAFHNHIYERYIHTLKLNPTKVTHIEEIPFLPIEFFKTHEVKITDVQLEKVFVSSGTGGAESKHYVSELLLYEQSFNSAFELFYGKPVEYVILALLPSYLERGNSSLVYMASSLINSAQPESGFFLDDFTGLKRQLQKLDKEKKVILLGASFALIDFIEQSEFKLNNTIVMETGGMKGRRKELVREELHAKLKKGFGVDRIHSEYGMTELLSQAYSKGDGLFECPPWMRVLIRDVNDPFTYLANNRGGGINIIDLANINSCSFIATKDLGKMHNNGRFEVLGRFDNSDIRGCNLLVA